MNGLGQILRNMSQHRPIFHSEADFQHTLAWALHLQNPNMNIRLEYPKAVNHQKYTVDIFAFSRNTRYFFELKYKKARIDNFSLNSEIYHFSNDNAYDQSCYDFCQDIFRLEQIVGDSRNNRGYCIFLSNASNYWQGGEQGTFYDNFKICEKRLLEGILRWRRGASVGTRRGREAPIRLHGRYTLRWRDYSNLEINNGQFRCLLIQVNP